MARDGDTETWTARRGRVMDRVHARLAAATVPRGTAEFASRPEPRSIGSPQRGRHLTAGSFLFAGHLVDAPDTAIWDLEMPAPGFEQALHGFLWLDDLAALGDIRARTRAQDWTWDWIARFGTGRGPGWTPALTGRRLTRWVHHGTFLLAGRDAAARGQFFGALAAQTTYLSRRWRGATPGLPRVEALSGLLFAGLAVTGQERHAGRAVRALIRAGEHSDTRRRCGREREDDQRDADLRMKANEWIGEHVAGDRQCRGLFFITPQDDPEWVRENVRRLGLHGLKCYHTMSDVDPTWEAAIEDYLPEPLIKVADEEEAETEAMIGVVTERTGVVDQTRDKIEVERTPADPLGVMAVVAAAWMLHETRPERFKSDDAFRVQVARLVRLVEFLTKDGAADRAFEAIEHVFKNAGDHRVWVVHQILSHESTTVGEAVWES